MSSLLVLPADLRLWTPVNPQDKVVASRLPNHWALKSIFITGIVYGLYLTLSSWVLFYVATRTSFFREKIGMHDLRYKPDSYLSEWCLSDNHLKVCPKSQQLQLGAATLQSLLNAVAASSAPSCLQTTALLTSAPHKHDGY